MSKEGSKSQHTVVIEPNRSWLNVRWAEIWQYRDLLRYLFYRDFAARYKQTVLGPLWFIIQPLVTTVVFTIIFGRVADIPTDGIPHVLFYNCGLLAWSFFAQTFGGCSGIFLTNATLFSKVYFPRMIVPITTCLLNGLSLVLNFVVFAVILFYFEFYTEAADRVGVNWSLIWILPLLILILLMTALGAGFWMTSLTAKYRDLAQLGGFITQMWMYGSSMVFPLTVLNSWQQDVIALNPMVTVVEGFRLVLLGESSLGLHHALTSLGVAALLFVTGFLMFQRTERRFVDTV